MRPVRYLPSHSVRASIAVLLLMRTLAFTQDVTEPALKASFIYNFALFTKWPGDVVLAQPFVICVLGDAVIGEAIERAAQGRLIEGRRIVVAQIPAPPSLQGCHILYVSGVTVGRAAEVVAEVRDLPVLTISDVDGFTEVGGIAQLYFDRGRLRFSIQAESATRLRLSISSKLLSLANPK